MASTIQETPSTFDEFQAQTKRQLFEAGWSDVDASLALFASYAIAVIHAASSTTEKPDLLEFMEQIGMKVRAELDAHSLNVFGNWITTNAHRFSYGWLEARQRHRQVAELEEKVKNLAASIIKGELDQNSVASSDGDDAKKRKREDELLSEIEELGNKAKKLKDMRSKSS